MSESNVIELVINQNQEVLEAELAHVHHQNGGGKIPPYLHKNTSVENLTVYEVKETQEQDYPDSTITLRPHSNGQYITLTVNLWDTERWGFTIGHPTRGLLDGTNILGADKSERCINFCHSFISHLEHKGFVVSNPSNTSASKGGRPKNEENQIALLKLLKGAKVELVYKEWLEDRIKLGRPETETSLREIFYKSVEVPFKNMRKDRM